MKLKLKDIEISFDSPEGAALMREVANHLEAVAIESIKNSERRFDAMCANIEQTIHNAAATASFQR